MSDSIYLLSPGEYQHDSKWDADLLTCEGRSQTMSAGEELLRRGLGKSAYLLSSDHNCAMQTADRIAEALNSEAIPSPNLRLGSESWRVVNHLGEFLVDSLLKDAEIDPEPGRAFIAVVHAPLIASLKRIKSDQVEPGKVDVFPFDAINPNYVD